MMTAMSRMSTLGMTMLLLQLAPSVPARPWHSSEEASGTWGSFSGLGGSFGGSVSGSLGTNFGLGFSNRKSDQGGESGLNLFSSNTGSLAGAGNFNLGHYSGGYRHPVAFAGVPGSGAQPGFGGQPGVDGQPGFGGQPGIGGPPIVGGQQPEVGAQPEIETQDGSGTQPEFGGQPGFGGEPEIGGQPGVGKQPGGNQPGVGGMPQPSGQAGSRRPQGSGQSGSSEEKSVPNHGSGNQGRKSTEFSSIEFDKSGEDLDSSEERRHGKGLIDLRTQVREEQTPTKKKHFFQRIRDFFG